MKKLTKFDFIMCIAFVCFITLGVTLACACEHKTNTDSLPELNPYDNDCDDSLISLYADGVIDFIYHTQDSEYVIEYDDEDSFDPDNMIYNNTFGYYYIEIYCDSNDFYEYLNWYNTLNRYDDRFKCSNATFGILEDSLIESDGSITYYYHLQKRH